jgi:hypothetical protein
MVLCKTIVAIARAMSEQKTVIFLTVVRAFAGLGKEEARVLGVGGCGHEAVCQECEEKVFIFRLFDINA